MEAPTPRERAVAWVLVGIQGALIVAMVVIPRRHAWESSALNSVALTAIGLAAIVGSWAAWHLGRGLTPLPLPNGEVELVVHGPYRWVRHPIYTAVITGMAGIAIRSRTPIVLGLALILAAFLALKARWEETHLRTAFPGYREYERSTGRLFPGIGRLKTED